MTNMNLYDASRQWAERPADERFASLPEMLDACRRYYEWACESSVPFNTLRAIGNDQSDEVTLTGNAGLEARLTYGTSVSPHAPFRRCMERWRHET
jgi:hypothetical protein